MEGPPVGEMSEILFDEGAVPYVVTVFIVMLVSVAFCFCFGMLLREYCERYLIPARARWNRKVDSLIICRYRGSWLRIGGRSSLRSLPSL